MKIHLLKAGELNLNMSWKYLKIHHAGIIIMLGKAISKLYDYNLNWGEYALQYRQFMKYIQKEPNL